MSAMDGQVRLDWASLSEAAVICAGALILFVAPPEALRRMGFTVQNLAAARLGSKRREFVQYEMRRTALTAITHALLLSLSCVWVLLSAGASLSDVAGSMLLFGHPMSLEVIVECVLGWAIVSCLAASAYLYYIHCNPSLHWIARELRLYDRDWESVATRINIQVEQSLPLEDGTDGFGVYVTDSWVLCSRVYRLLMSRQSDIDVSVVSSLEVADPAVGPAAPPLQVLSVRVSSVRPGAAPFVIKMYASELEQLRSKITSGVRVAPTVSVVPTAHQLFVEELAHVATENTLRLMAMPAEARPRMQASPGDTCVGCMSAPATMCIRRTCHVVPGNSTLCGTCTCRPFWCLPCMARYFASQQSHGQATWRSTVATCPSCHVVFCANDIVNATLSAGSLAGAQDNKEA